MDHIPKPERIPPKLVLLNDAAMCLPQALAGLAPDETADETVVVAGTSQVRLALAELALPGSTSVWCDFRLSASLGSLLAGLRAKGGLNRLILAANGKNPEDIFAIMQTILNFAPILRQNTDAEIHLFVSEGEAKASLVAFLNRIAPDQARRISLNANPEATRSVVA